MIGPVIAFILIPSVMCSLTFGSKFIPPTLDECVDSNICDNIPNYPTEEMEKFIRELERKGIRPNKVDASDLAVTDFRPRPVSRPPESIPDYSQPDKFPSPKLRPSYVPPMKMPGLVVPSSNIPSTPNIPSPSNIPLSSFQPKLHVHRGETNEIELIDYDYEYTTSHKPQDTFDTMDKEINLCRSKAMIKYPQSARGKDKKWYYVLNRDRDPYQAFHVEVCASDALDKPCGNDDLEVIFYSGYESRCVQKYMYRSMLAVNYTGQVFWLYAEIPSCCSCIARMLLD